MFSFSVSSIKARAVSDASLGESNRNSGNDFVFPCLDDVDEVKLVSHTLTWSSDFLCIMREKQMAVPVKYIAMFRCDRDKNEMDRLHKPLYLSNLSLLASRAELDIQCELLGYNRQQHPPVS